MILGAGYTLRIENKCGHSPPLAGQTAFQTISVRRQGLISRSSIRASARSLTLAARSVCRSTRQIITTILPLVAYQNAPFLLTAANAGLYRLASPLDPDL